jgi:hypothetical protein
MVLSGLAKEKAFKVPLAGMSCWTFAAAQEAYLQATRT